MLFFLSWAHWNDLIASSFSAYVMSGGKQQGKGGDEEETKQSQKVKSRLRNFGRMGGFPP